MHVDVNELLGKGEGAQLDLPIEGQPQFEDVNLAEPLSGTVRLLGTKDGIIAVTDGRAAIQLTCDRCLIQFEQPIFFSGEAEFVDQPEDDQYPIDRYGKIDLAEPIRQDILVQVPLQLLCKPDCKGIQLT